MLKIRWIVCVMLLINWTSSWSEVTLDGSRGPVEALGGSDYQIREGLGTRAGSNLFHSFEQFNIGENESATFSGSPDIQNVISRVTGGSPSTIDGTIRSTIPNANLFLINPFGVIFGKNASLDVQGSFHASTADYLGFTDGAQFSAELNNTDQVLTSASPEAFGFLGNNPTSSITLSGADLKVPEGKSLSLIGGDIALEGGKLRASGGRIDIASVNSEGEVLRLDDDLQLNGFQQLATIDLNQTALVDASGEGGGAIFIRGGELILDGSKIKSDTLGDTTGKPIDIELSQGTLELRNGGVISTLTAGSAKGSDIFLKADSVKLSGNEVDNVTKVLTKTEFQSSASAGDIIIQSNSLDVQSYGKISTEGTHTGVILIDAGKVRMVGSGLVGIDAVGTGASILSSTTGKGKNIIINTSSLVLYDGADILILGLTNIENLGDIIIKADNLELRNGSVIAHVASSRTGVARDAGEIIIETGNMLLSGDGAVGFTGVQTLDFFAQGSAANIKIVVTNLEIRNGAKIDTQALSSDKASNLIIKAEKILLTGEKSGIFGQNNLFLEAKEQVSTSKITLVAEDLEVRNGAAIKSNAVNNIKGGDINLEVKNILLSGGGVTDTGLSSSAGKGDAGNITISENESLILDNATISVDSTSSNAGNIFISTDNLVELRNNSQITTSVVGGSGGDIIIGGQFVDTRSVLKTDLIVLDNSNIIARARVGSGGKIDITSNLIFISSNSVVDASSNEGNNGQVGLVAIFPATNLIGSLVALPEAYLSASDHLSPHCSARAANVSSFVIKDRGGIPPGPDDAASSVFYGDDSYQELSEDRLSAASSDPIDARESQNINTGLVIAESGCGE